MKLRTSQTPLRLLTFFIIISALFLGAGQPSPVLAQQSANPVFENVQVDVWPEYDQPAVLVIYHITISTQVTLPANLSIRIPAAAGKPFAVAMSDTNGLYNINYDLGAAGDWITVNFTAPVPDVRVEFYDPSLTIKGNQRDYTFRWPADYTVNNLLVSVQQPPTATGVTFRPEIGAGTQGSDGLTYYNVNAGKVDAGTEFDLALTYQKANDSLTSAEEFAPAQPNQPINQNTPGRIIPQQLLPWIIGGLGALLIAAGAIWYWRTGHAPAVAFEAGKRRHGSRPTSAVSPAEPDGDGIFCHNCGKKAGAGDVFCRACGSKLR